MLRSRASEESGWADFCYLASVENSLEERRSSGGFFFSRWELFLHHHPLSIFESWSLRFIITNSIRHSLQPISFSFFCLSLAGGLRRRPPSQDCQYPQNNARRGRPATVPYQYNLGDKSRPHPPYFASNWPILRTRNSSKSNLELTKPMPSCRWLLRLWVEIMRTFHSTVGAESLDLDWIVLRCIILFYRNLI